MDKSSGQATFAQVQVYLAEHWIELATGAYESYRGDGRGLYLFATGIVEGNAFGLVTAKYVTRADYVHYFAVAIPNGEKITALIDSYDPDQTLIGFIHQGEPSLAFTWGVPQGLPSPKSVWEAHKDDPDLTP